MRRLHVHVDVLLVRVDERALAMDQAMVMVMDQAASMAMNAPRLGALCPMSEVLHHGLSRGVH